MKPVHGACLLVSVALALGVAASDGARFRVESDRLDLGQVKSGEEIVAVFVFHNDGPNPVRILRAKPS